MKRQQFSGGPTLQTKAIGAAGWTLGLTGGQYAFRLASNLVMTRLLLPESFGLLGFAAMVITAMALLTDIGIGQSIIRERDGEDPEFLQVAWTVKILRSLVISIGIVAVAGVIAVLAPLLASPGTVYADDRLPLLVALTSIAALLQGFDSTNKDAAFRRLEYRAYSIISLVSQVLSIITMICFALISPTVWSLLAGMLSNGLYLCILTHIALPGPAMQFSWNNEIAARLWHFGKWIILSSTFTFLQANFDRIYLGALFTSQVLGLYIIAQIWATSARGIITLLGDRVAFPAISEVLQTRPHDLDRVYGKFQKAIDVLSITAFLALFLGSPLLVKSLYTSSYHGAAHYLKLMAVTMLVARFDLLSNMLISSGNSRASTIISLIRVVSICIVVPACFNVFGEDIAIISLTLIPLLSTPYALYCLRNLISRRQILTGYLWIALSLCTGALVGFL